MTLTPYRLRCEHLENPLGLHTPAPWLRWALMGDGHDRAQTAYQVIVSSTPAHLGADHGDLWNSGRVEGTEQLHVPYAGAPLTSRQACYWKVRVWDEHDQPGPWSALAFWETALLSRADWSAIWIEHDAWKRADEPSPAPLLRRTFILPAPVRRARLYASALGVYQAHLNGHRVGDLLLMPGWTDYHVRVPYQTYDVSDLLREGDNVLGAMLGDGWYAGCIGFRGERRHYGPRPRFLAQLEAELETGEVVTVTTDGRWKGETGPLRSSDYLAGETYDAREERPGWDRPGFDDRGWKEAVTVPWHARLVADQSAPTREITTLEPVAVEPRPHGAVVYDLGQNMVGWARVRVRGEAQRTMTLRYAEMLEADGSLYTEALRTAKATDTYVCRGDAEETYEPRFTFHGFRYVEVSGDAEVLNLVGVVIGSDTPDVGTFACSDDDVNKLQSNIRWGQRGNFLSVPTDCPQRDERLGWLGDAQVFVHTAALNADVSAFFTKWMQDVEDAQSPAGGFPDVAPRVVVSQDGAPGWGNAGVIVPWELYRHYGDVGLLQRHWDAMTRWLTFLEEANPDGVWRHRRGNDFGDWLAQDGDDPTDAFGSRTPKDVVATAFWAQDAALMTRMARVLGKNEDAERYGALFERVQSAFVTNFLEENGWVRGRTQTGQTLALAFDLLPERVRPAALDRLVELIEARGDHLTTGFLGVRHLLPTLTRFGRADVAHRLLVQDTFPSWLYSIRQGATTIWERWDGFTREKGFSDPGMNSFNHYSLGSVGQWLYESVAGLGLGEDTPAFSHVVIAPQPGALAWARAEHESARGRVNVAWRVEGDTFHLNVLLPPNTRGTVRIPAPYTPSELIVGSGTHALTARAVSLPTPTLTEVTS